MIEAIEASGVGEGDVGRGDHRARRDLGRRHDGDREVGAGAQEIRRRGRHEQVESEVGVGLGHPDLARDVDDAVGDAEVRDHRPALLAQARLVEARDVLAVEEGGGPQDLVHGHDAGAADPHQEEARRPADAQLGLGKLPVDRVALAGPGARAVRRHHREERRAVAQEARVVLVAGRLVDLGLPTELRLDRLDGQAVRLHAAVAASLADQLVDDDAHGGIGQLAALSEPTLLGGAALVVDQGGDARHFAEDPLGLVQPVPVPDLDAGRPPRVPRVLARLVGEDQDPPHALGLQLARELRHRHRARRVLAAGHRDRGVVEDLEGHVGARRDRLADGQRPRVKERPVAELLEEVRHVDERREADPLGALAPHLGDPDDVPSHVHGEAVTADPRGRHRSLGHDGRAIVGAAGAEVRRPDQGQRDRALARRLDDRHTGADRVETDPAIEAAGDDAGDRVGVELAVRGDEDLTGLVALADDAGAVGELVERLAEQQLDEAALLFDHEQLLEPARELTDDPALEREEHAELEEPDPVPPEGGIVEAQVGQGLPEVVVGLARRHDPEPRVRRRDGDPVEPVGGGKRPGGLEATVHDLTLDVERVGRQEARGLSNLPRAAFVSEPRLHDGDPLGGDRRGADGVGDVGHHLEGHP